LQWMKGGNVEMNLRAGFVRAGKAVEGHRTPKRWRVDGKSPNCAKLLGVRPPSSALAGTLRCDVPAGAFPILASGISACPPGTGKRGQADGAARHPYHGATPKTATGTGALPGKDLFSTERELSQLAAGGMTRNDRDDFEANWSGGALRAEPRLGIRTIRTLGPTAKTRPKAIWGG